MKKLKKCCLRKNVFFFKLGFLLAFILNVNFSYSLPHSVLDTTKTKKSAIRVDKKQVKGKVLDEKGKPMPGVSIVIKNTTLGIATDIDGKFNMEFLEIHKNPILIFSFIGYESQEIKYKDIKDNENLVVKLKICKQKLEEVVVTGYANINKKSFTGNAVSVSKEDILKVNKSNIVKALQTFAPSLRINVNNAWGSDPNKMPEFYIRGKSGIGTKTLDGINLNKDINEMDLSRNNLQNNPNLPLFILDGFEVTSEKMYDMDPERIENITILKDAAATAMYGSRAANGVIVITSKKPEKGKFIVTYSFNSQLLIPDLSDYNLMNAAEKLEAERIAGYYDLTDSDTKIEKKEEYIGKLYNIKKGVDTYWLSKPLETVFNQKHSVFVEGGSDDIRFGIDLKTDNNGGVMKESYRNRNSVGFYVDYKLKNFQIRNYITYNNVASKDSPYGSFSDYTSALPYQEYLDEYGNQLKKLRQWHMMIGLDANLNPLYEAQMKSFSKEQYDEIRNDLSLNWYITPHLHARAQLGVSKQYKESNKFIDPNSGRYANKTVEKSNEKGELRTSDVQYSSMTANMLLMYNRLINKHNINFTVGTNAVSNSNLMKSATYRGFANGDMHKPSNAEDIYNKPSFSDNKTRLFGLLSTLNYTYNNIYLCDISYRLDGSSEFGTDKKYAPFWSCGFGINLHNYNFLKDKEYLNRLKIRASYGTTGKVNFPPYVAHSMYQIMTSNWYSTGYGVTLDYLGNDNLKWEITKTTDVGFDATLFDNRLNIYGSYYYKLTEDLITDMTIPSSSGFTVYKDNIGEVENKGYEINMRLGIIQSKSLNVSVFGNLSHNENKIVKISEALKAYNEKVNEYYKNYEFQQSFTEYSRPFTKYEEGNSLNDLYGVRSLGIDPATGKELYLKKDGSITYEWDANDQVAICNTEPKLRGAFGLNARYKDFELFASFMYKLGGQQYNRTLITKVENADIKDSNVDKRVILDRWQNPGDIVPLKDISDIKSTTRPTSRFVMDDNELSLTSLTFAYYLNKEFLKKIHISNAKIELSSNDLFKLSTIKQERGLYYPFARTINLNLRIQF